MLLMFSALRKYQPKCFESVCISQEKKKEKAPKEDKFYDDIYFNSRYS